MKYRFIDMHRSQFRMERMCRALGVSRSGYYGWKRPGTGVRKRQNDLLLHHIAVAHKQSRKTYGSPRITVELRSQGIACSENRIARLMRLNGIIAKTKKRYRVTTRSKHTRPVTPNLLKGRPVDAPNAVWVSDITYIRTSEGWLYLAVILDMFSRYVVGWSMGERLTDDLVVHAFDKAVMRKNPAPAAIFHSDRGSQYAGDRLRGLLLRHDMTQSMSGKGNCYDNAAAESFFSTLKTELGHSYGSRSTARQAIFEYIEVFYNRVRRHSSLNYMSPLDYEMHHMASLTVCP